MMIYSQDKVRQAVARALLLDPTAGTEAAIAAAAQALCLPHSMVAACVDLEPAR